MDVSEQYYQHCKEYPIYGTGQGSGNSPHIWCFISSTLFDAFAEHARGATFTSYDGKKSMRLYMVGFVDDCGQQVNEFSAYPQPTPERLIELMQQDAQLWNNLLTASGGALEIPKCSFQLIVTDWSSRGRPFLQGQCQAPPLEIVGSNGPIRVQQLSSYKARRSLGIHLSPSGMMNTQYEILLAKSKKYAEAVLTNALTRREAYVMFHGIYIPSITYPLSMTCLTEGQCHAIETPFLKVILPRCGYNRTMSRHIRYAPIRYGGAGFLNLFVEQSIRTILSAIKYLRCPAMQMGQMELIALTWAQAHAGVSWCIWGFPERKLPHLPMPWINGVRKALTTIQGKIILSADHIPQPLRANDWYIMDAALEAKIFSTTEIEDINAYRRYYQATTASDLTAQCGTKIREDIWQGIGHPHPSEFTGEFFNQAQPNVKARQTWKKFLLRFAHPNRQWKSHLEEWIVTHGQCRRRPQWIYDPRLDQLYQRQQQQHYSLCATGRDGKYYLTEAGSDAYTTPPQDAYPVDAVLNATTVYITAMPSPEIIPSIRRYGSFTEYINTLEPWEYQLLQNARMCETAERTMELLNDGAELFISSDGSVIENKYGSFGFTITHVTSTIRLATGNGPVHAAKPSSFRAEAYGVLAATRFIKRLTEYTGSTLTQEITHFIDNQGVVQRLKDELSRPENPNATLQPDWDIINEAILTIKELSESKYQFKWVKAHQDRTSPYDALPLEAQMNCDADTLATSYHISPNG